MSTFTERIQAPSSYKIYLAEIDIMQVLEHAVNYRAYTNLVNLDISYSFIDSQFLSGVETIDIANIGSMKSDGTLLAKVASAADVQNTDMIFYWDLANKNLYFRLQNGDRWRLHRVTIGEVFGVAKPAVNFADFGYEGRLLTFPGINREKDPLSFGRLSYKGGRIEIRNDDGYFDTFCEDQDTVEAVCRVKQGFRGFSYSEFVQTAVGIAERYSIGPSVFAVDFRDPRGKLENKIPAAVFDQTTYPDLKDSNVGKSIPVAYGVLRNVPVICTNEDESPTPADYDFKLADTTYHGIGAITEVRVEGVAKTPSASSLANATFSLAAADYSPGDEVRVDFSGYVDALDALIDNPLDIIRDLLTTYYPIKYNANFFNTTEWEAAKAASPDVHYWSDKPVEIEKIIEEICNSTFVSIIPTPDERYTARYFDAGAGVAQSFTREQVMGTPTIEVDSTEMLRYVRVGYDRDWAGDDKDPFKYYTHDSEDERISRLQTFETLLTNQTDALAFAQKVLAILGVEYKPFDVELKLQALEREIMDVIQVEVWRARKAMLGTVKAEIIGIRQNPEKAGMTLNCRMLEVV